MEAKKMNVNVPDFSDLSKNANNIVITDQTKNLIKCFAVLDDVYECVAYTMLNTYTDAGEEIGILDGFDEAHKKLVDEVMKLISTSIEVTMSNSNFKYM